MVVWTGVSVRRARRGGRQWWLLGQAGGVVSCGEARKKLATVALPATRMAPPEPPTAAGHAARGSSQSHPPALATATRRVLLARSFTRPTPGACLSITLESTGQARRGSRPRTPPRGPSTSRFVRCPRRRFLPALSIVRHLYTDAGARPGGVGDEGDARGGQKRAGGAHDKGGRPVGTRRFTRETLSTGCRKAMAMALSQYGVESVLRRVKAQTTCTLSAEELSSRLSTIAGVFYRGQVWPLMHIFGFFSKCEGGMASVTGERDVSCTWVGRNGFINCSCQGRTRLLGVMRRPEADAADIECTHGAAMAHTLRKLGRTLAIAVRAVRAVVGNLHRRCRSRHPDVVNGDGGDDGDCERFVVGQSVYGIAVTGHGDTVVTAPVRFTRKTTTCMLCDTARTAACVHVALTRHFNRSAEAREQRGSAPQHTGPETDDSACGGDTAYSEADVAQSISQNPIGMFNCRKATLADAEIGELVAKGGILRIAAPGCCPKCNTPRGSAADVGADGVILATAGPCNMHLEAYLCLSDQCGQWVSADGRDQGIVIYTSCTAASAVLMRQWAFALILDGTTYASSYESWRRLYLDRRDAGNAAACHIRGKQTTNKVFHAAVRLMTDDPPMWCFSCPTCQDSDGRFRVVTADGIWLGFLRRLASKMYKNPCQPCQSVPEYVQAGSLYGSEAVRRFIRLALKQPAKAVVIKTNQLPSAEKALFFLCPASLPANRVPSYNDFEDTKLAALHGLIDRVWVLDRAAVELARGIVKRIRHVLTTEIANSRPASRVASDVATAAHIRSWLDSVAPPAGAPAGGDGQGGVAGGGQSEGSSDGGSSSEPGTPQPPPPPRPGRRGRRAAGGAGGGRLPPAVARAGREAAAARRHHEQVTVAEPSDPRCLRPEIKQMEPDQFKPIMSLCVALATDSVVNAFKPRHLDALKSVADDLAAVDAASRIDTLLGAACDPAARAPPLVDGDAPIDPRQTLSASKARVTHELRLLMACLLAMRFNEPVFELLRKPVAAVLHTVCATVKDYHLPKEGAGNDRSALDFGEEWLDPTLSPNQLLERFRARFPHASDDPMVTGCFFPGLRQCRPGPFAAGEKLELGMCAKHYQAIRKYFSPGTFTICCACAHPKLIGFVVLEKREGPYALLNAIITRFALLPHFIVYDFGCGALRSAIGKLPVFVALVVIISDLFHIVNHVCSDIFNPRSYSPLDGKNTVAHEQRNSPIAAMMKTLRACGQDEYMRIMKLHTILHNVHAQARGSCTYPLPDDYNFRQFFFSRQVCPCGCGQQEEGPPLPSPPSSVPSTPSTSEGESTSSPSEEERA